MSPDPCLPRTTSHAARFSPQHPGGAPTTLSDKPILARPRRPPRGCSNASASPAALTSFEQVGRPLPQRFFARSALDLAPALLGLVLCHRGPGGLVGGRIVEGEASTAPSAAEVPAEAVDWVADVVRRTVAEVVRVQAAGNAQFDLAAIRSAYEAGYVRASYDCGGQPADLGGDHYRYVEAADLRPWQGDGPWEATLAREHAAA